MHKTLEHLNKDSAQAVYWVESSICCLFAKDATSQKAEGKKLL